MKIIELLQKLLLSFFYSKTVHWEKRKEKWMDLEYGILCDFMYVRRDIGYYFVFWIVPFRLLNLKVQVISHDRSSVKHERFYYTSEREKVLGVFSPVVGVLYAMG